MTMTRAKIARIVGISRQRVGQLLDRGDTVESILASAYKRPRVRRGPPKSAHTLALEAAGVTRAAYYARRRRGESHEQAMSRPSGKRGRPRKGPIW